MLWTKVALALEGLKLSDHEHIKDANGLNPSQLVQRNTDLDHLESVLDAVLIDLVIGDVAELLIAILDQVRHINGELQ